MKRITVAAALAVLALGLATLWLTRDRSQGQRVVEPGRPLPMDETVQLHFVDEETGEKEIWTVTKRDTSPEERHARALPEPDPDVKASSGEADKSAWALRAMAMESWKRGEILEAKALLEQAIETDPDDPQPRTQYGRLMMLAMAYSEALPHLERAAELSPYDPQVWLDLATYYEKKLIFEQSWEALRRAEELADGREIWMEERAGFWVVEGESIYP